MSRAQRVTFNSPDCPICAVKPLPSGDALYDYNQRLFEHYEQMNSREEVEQHESDRCRWLGCTPEQCTEYATRRGQAWEQRQELLARSARSDSAA